ncbi:MAG TPA: DUF881 domain-containing protein [Armatimonadota bacterium]|nr:DUF881 domain-containing protein [Armatimonadota bacterium]
MKMHVPLGKPQPWVLPVTIVCLALGALIATLIGASTGDEAIDTTQLNREQLAVLYAQAMRENRDQQRELDQLRADQTKLTNGAITEQKLKQQIDDLRVSAGITPVQGPGIFILIDDTGNIKNSPVDPNTNLRVVHDSDLLTLVNELHAAGAEAISVNDQRVVGSTAIRCAGPTIQVNGTAIAPPFRVSAIGNPATLYGAVNMPNGVFDWLRPLGIHVDVSKRDKMTVPAIKVLPQIQFGKPVLDDKDDGDTEQ